MATRSDWDQFFEDARNVNILEAARNLGAQLKRAGSAEWSGPCPLCRGTDRFSVNTQKRVYNCRGSSNAKGKSGGDVIDMVIHVTGCSTIEACERLTGRARPDRSRDETVEERTERQQAHERRAAQARDQEDAERRREASRARLDEQHIDDVLARAVALDDPRAAHGRAYLETTRGLHPVKRLLIDIKFVEELDYWGLPGDATERLVLLDALPAIVAIIRDVFGGVIGIAQTFLDKVKPEKWRPAGSVRNSPKKIRGDKKGGMIRCGRISEILALSEGWENVLAWDELRRKGVFGEVVAGEDVSLAAAVDLGNLAGKSTGAITHPKLKDGEGRQLRISNGEPDPVGPGAVIPEGVRSIIIVADTDSEWYATTAKLQCAARRYLASGFEVNLCWPTREPTDRLDFNDLLLREAERSHA